MASMRILVLDTNHPVLVQTLTKSGFEVVEDYQSSLDEVLDRVHEFQGLVVRSRFNIDQAFINKAKNLKFIARVGAGMDSIDVEYARSQGIVCLHSPQGNAVAVGEHCVGMLLSLFNKLFSANMQVKKGIWNREENRGEELAGKTVGIIGYGNMGNAFAQRLSGFQVEVIFYDILSGLENQYAGEVTLEELFEKADVLSLHTPLTPLTRGLINKDFLSKFSKPIYVINAARGKSLVIKDLLWGLDSGKVLGACLDVLEVEESQFQNDFKDPENKDLQALLQSDKIIFSPHIAGWTHQSKYKLAYFISQQIIDKFGV
ncbi:MAG: hydroxyacid dehydrogenase [Flavobacteriaceae bacterium]|nr:MAG: hydroxyacid dehydrogenase [Flavobacteriaceae bacterium]